MKKFIPTTRALFLLVAFLALPYTTSAARLSIELPHHEVKPNGELVVKVFLDTEGESLNAFEGTLLFPADLLSVKEVRDGGSVVTVWIEKPLESKEGRISFSGITPGGYKGDYGSVLSVVFETKGEGVGMLSLQDIQLLKNDGAGSAVRVSSAPTNFSVITKADAIPEEERDSTPPEPFTILIEQSPDVFEGNKFLVFATQDKNPGIAYFEVCEGLFASCVKATSPYELEGQNADSLIKVRAVDLAGNERSAQLFTSRAIMRYSLYAVLVILCGVGALYVLIRRLRRYL